jgi:hypothetical protein
MTIDNRQSAISAKMGVAITMGMGIVHLHLHGEYALAANGTVLFAVSIACV